ncbi:restriction endonuclease [Rhodobacteraceae bacterium F11138]|nr:restriction endonuclease [Rhodobacteraceae bacterium F11138]
MSIPDYQTFMLPVLRKAAGGEVKISSVIEELSDEFGLSEDEKAELLPSGKQTVVANRIHWAKTYLKQAGLVDATRRGHFVISERGRAVLAENPTSIDNSLLETFTEFQDFKNRQKTPSADGGGESKPEGPPLGDKRTPDEVMREAHGSIEDALRGEMLEKIREASPAFFEGLVVNLLVAMGYGGSVTDAGRALGRSGDGGIDGVIDQDALGLDRVYIQAKRYANGNNVGPGAIRDFFGSLDRFKASKGLFVSTSSFTKEAVATAQALSKRIVLIDSETLTKLMIRYNVGCRVEETLYVRKLDEDFFTD